VGRRFEESVGGQVVMSVVGLALMALVLGWNLPDSRAKDKLSGTVDPVIQSLGLEQDWALFAPNPRDTDVGVYATVTYRDGHTSRWTPPHNGILVSPYRTYRWQKYVERLRDDKYSGLWEPTARWVAREAGPGATKVELTRTFRDVVVPGAGGKRPATSSYTFYTYVVTR